MTNSFEDLEKDNFDKKTLLKYAHCFCVLFTICFTVFVLGPVNAATAANLMLDNTVIATVIVFFLGLSLLFACCVFLLHKWYKYLEVFLTSILILCLLNLLIIPFQAGILDGRDELRRIGDDIMPIVRNSVVFLVCLLTVSAFRKYLRFVPVAVLIVVVAFAGIGVRSMYTGSFELRRQEEAIRSAATFSTGRNVVVIVLDMMQGTVAERVFEEHPQFLDYFEGFTLFTRAFSSFPFTMFSKQAIQSGQLYSSDKDSDGINNVFQMLQEHNQQSLSNSFLSDLHYLGVGVNIIGGLQYGRPVFNINTQEEFQAVRGIRRTGPWVVFRSAMNTSLARLTGYWLPNPFIATTLPPSLEPFTLMMEQSFDDIDTFNLLIDWISAYDEQDKLLYLWKIATHTPVAFAHDGQIIDIEPSEMTEQDVLNEVYFFFTQLTRLFDAMKNQGVYDNSLIIITSDHGTFLPNLAVREEHFSQIDDFSMGGSAFGNIWPVGMYNSVLFVKPPNAAGQALLTHDPAWNGDVRALINYYYEHFDYIPPVDVVARIRANEPEVGVMFARQGRRYLHFHLSLEYHEIVYVTSLHDIPAAFAAHSASITD